MAFDFKSVVFSSNTGFTEAYARMLSDEIGVPVFSLKQACRHLQRGDSVFYIGWVKASRIIGLRRASGRFSVAGVASVGLMMDGESLERIKRGNGISDNMPYFALPGGLALDKLHGLDKLLFNLGRKAMARTSREPGKDNMETYKILTEGVSFVDKKHLKPIINAYRKPSKD